MQERQAVLDDGAMIFVDAAKDGHCYGVCGSVSCIAYVGMSRGLVQSASCRVDGCSLGG